MNTTAATTTPSNYQNHALRGILLGGFFAGLADFIYPTVKTVMAGKSWMTPWKGVASGLLGQPARDGGLEMVVLGAALHWFICIGAAALLYLIVSRVKWLPRQWVVLGCIHGIARAADHELRDPAALGHRPRHLSTRAAAHPRVLAHRAGGSADGVLRVARVEGHVDALTIHSRHDVQTSCLRPIRQHLQSRSSPAGTAPAVDCAFICRSRISRTAFSARTPGARTSTRWARSPCSRSATRS